MRLFSKIAILSVMFIYGCSEEELGESSNPIPEPEIQISKGKFIDSEVQGLKYSTPTQNGVTNSSGKFEYLTGESVTFKVGNIVLGTAEGKSIITPLEIASTPNASLESPEVKNISAFLQTLDADKNPSNGISISQDAVAFLPENQIDFNSNIIETLGNFVLEVNKNTLADIEVVLPEEAAVHLAKTLGEPYTRQGLDSGPFFNIIERWETDSRNVTWIHIYDEQGRITESNAYEKYPSRHILKHEYLQYNSVGYPIHYTSNHIKQDGSDGFLSYFYLEYGEDAEIKSLKYSPSPNSTYFYGWKIEEVDEKNQVLKTSIFEEGGQGVSNSIIEYEYFDNGKKKFEQISDLDSTEPRSRTEWTYEDFGEMHTWKQYFGENLNSERIREYTYRDDYTLEKQIIVENSEQNPDSKEIILYNDLEWVIRHEKYRSEFLYELIETDYEAALTKATYFNQQDGSYYIKYRDHEEGLYKTEYYDSDGNLISTEEH